MPYAPGLIPAPPRAVRVLLIEDDADARANLRDILELDEFVVESAASIQEGISNAQGRDYDFIILDRRLPDGSAEEALPRIRRASPRAGIVIVTGYTDLDGVISALREGADDYLLKPVNPELLRKRLAQLREQRRLEAESRRSEDAFRALVESAGCMIVILRADHRTAYFNAFAEELTGYAANEAIDRDFFALLLPADEQQRCRDVFDCVLQGAQLRNYQTTLLRQDGTRAEVLWNARRLDRGADGVVLLAVGQDITSLTEAQRRALQSERLAAIGQMVAGLAHESRNALQRIQACLEMLDMEIEGNAAAQDLVARIQRAQDQLKKLFDEVRGYVAPIQLERDAHSLVEVWREAWELLTPQRAGRDVRFQEQIGADVDPVCHVDRFRLLQVFRNLLENALAACRDPAELEIACQRAVWHGVDAVRVLVRDNGTGLTAEQRQRVFEPFFTTKTHGTGLGMPIAKRIVDAHGGDLAVGVESKQGAEFSLVLPRNRP